MVSEQNRIYKFTPRRKKTPEEKVKLKSILEKARKIKGTKPIPLTYKQRLDNLESNNNNTNNSINNSENEEVIPTIDYLTAKLDDLEDIIDSLKTDNADLLERIQEVETSTDATEDITNTLQDELDTIKDVNNNTSNNQSNDKLELEINNMNVKINALETQNEEHKKDISEIFSDLNELEDRLDN
jgi:chromosome segregation ATPase